MALNVVRLAESYSSGDEQRSELLAEGLPASVLVRPVTGSGKIDRATAPNPPKRARACRSSAVAGRCSRSMCLQRADRRDDVAGLGFFAGWRVE